MWFGALIPLDPIPASRCHCDPYPTRREAQFRTLSAVGHATTSKHAFETVSEGGVFCSLLVRGVMGRAFTVHSGFELLHVLVSGLFSIFCCVRADCGMRCGQSCGATLRPLSAHHIKHIRFYFHVHVLLTYTWTCATANCNSTGSDPTSVTVYTRVTHVPCAAWRLASGPG